MTDGWDFQHRSRNRLPRVSLVEAQQHGSYHTQVPYNNVYQQCSTVKRHFAVHTPRFYISSGLWILPGIQTPDSVYVCVCSHIKTWILPGHCVRSSGSTASTNTFSFVFAAVSPTMRCFWNLTMPVHSNHFHFNNILVHFIPVVSVF